MKLCSIKAAIVFTGTVPLLFGVWKLAVRSELKDYPSKFAAEAMVRFIPDLERISINDFTERMEIRIKSRHKIVGIRYDDLALGRIVEDNSGRSVSYAEGNLSEVPGWVPRYPGAIDERAVAQGTDQRRTSGALTFTTTASPEEVEKYFRAATHDTLPSHGLFTVGSSPAACRVSATYHGKEKELATEISAEAGKHSLVQVIYRGQP